MFQNPELDAAPLSRAPREAAPARPTRPPVDWSETPIAKMRACGLALLAFNAMLYGALWWWLS